MPVMNCLRLSPLFFQKNERISRRDPTIESRHLEDGISAAGTCGGSLLLWRKIFSICCRSNRTINFAWSVVRPSSAPHRFCELEAVGGGAATRAALPLLWRPHVRHRDLRCRLPTTLPADRNQDRYLMSETATFRTPTTNGLPRWSLTRYAAARPNTCPVLHSAPHPSAKRIVNATQSKQISQTKEHFAFDADEFR